MAVHLVVRQNGQPAKVWLATGNEFPQGVGAGDVIFGVRSEQPERSEAIAGAVCAVFNHWCIQAVPHEPQVQAGGMQVRGFNDDQPNFEAYSGPNKHYVYAYGHRRAVGQWQGGWHRDHVFYVGMGRGNRYSQHLNRPEGAGANESRKVKRIELALGAQPWNGRGAEIVRHAAAFVGAHAEAQAAAVERFLITHHFGVYLLTNSTGGNRRHGKLPDRWLALPRGATVFDEWGELLQILMAGQETETAQTLRRGLTARAVSAQVQWNLTDVADGPRRLVRTNPNGDLFTSDGTDVASEHQMVYDGQPVLRVQFRMSENDGAFRINLRPLKGKERDFTGLIAAMFFDGAEGIAAQRIRDQPRTPFFKPCAAGGNGRRDVDFDCSDLDKSYTLVDVPHFGVHLPWNTTLKEVLLNILSRLPRPAQARVPGSGVSPSVRGKARRA